MLLKEITALRRASNSDPDRWPADMRALFERGCEPDAGSRIVRHMLNLPIRSSDPGAVGATADYDAVCEIWAEGLDAENWSRSRSLFEQTWPSAIEVVDRARSTALLVEEVVIGAPRASGYKIISFLWRGATLPGDAFYAYWKNEHGPLVRSVPEFWRHVRGYVQNHPVAAPRALAPGGQVDAYDGITQIWFDSDADAVRAFSEPRYLDVIRADEAILRSGPPRRLIAQEIEAPIRR